MEIWGLMEKANKLMKLAMHVLSLFSVLWLMVAMGTAGAASLSVVYPKNEVRDKTITYPLALLRLAMKNCRCEYSIAPSVTTYISERRQRKILETDDRALTVAWFGTSIDYEHRLLPVRVPIYLGLLGHRIFLINKNKQIQFNDVKTLADLAPFLAIQGKGWSDVEILTQAGLNVTTANYRNIFGMIAAGRADYFPRGVHEAFSELKAIAPKNPNLSVEKKLLLIYPFAMFFFVAPSNRDLHDAIYSGLVNSWNNGSLLALFKSHPSIGGILKKARLDKRRTIRIANPLFSDKTKTSLNRFKHKF